MAENYKLDDLYLLVLDGKWTFDKFGKYVAAAVSYLNGDGKMDDKDQYGFISLGKYVLPNFWMTAGEFTIDKDGTSNFPYLAIHDSNGASDQHLLPLFGSIRWPDFIGALKEINCGGYFTFEISSFYVEKMNLPARLAFYKLAFEIFNSLSAMDTFPKTCGK